MLAVVGKGNFVNRKDTGRGWGREINSKEAKNCNGTHCRWEPELAESGHHPIATLRIASTRDRLRCLPPCPICGSSPGRSAASMSASALNEARSDWSGAVRSALSNDFTRSNFSRAAQGRLVGELPGARTTAMLRATDSAEPDGAFSCSHQIGVGTGSLLPFSRSRTSARSARTTSTARFRRYEAKGLPLDQPIGWLRPHDHSTPGRPAPRRTLGSCQAAHIDSARKRRRDLARSV